LNEIWDRRLDDYGLTGEAANSSVMTTLLYGATNIWGLPEYDPTPMIADELCNIADSTAGMESVHIASEVLCETNTDADDSSTISARAMSLLSTGERSANGDQPSVTYILKGIANVSVAYAHLSFGDHSH
jgi:hypothetical protein